MSLPNVDGHQSAGRNDFIPWLKLGGPVRVSERYQLLCITQRTDLRETKNAIFFTLRCLETERPDEVRVGTEYTLYLDLDKPGNANEKGTQAYYALQELANVGAALLGTTTIKAAQDGVSITKELNDYMAMGEDVAELGMCLTIDSKLKPLYEKDAKKKDDLTRPIMKNGQHVHITNHYYSPAASAL